jgi:hypothetical protein
MLGLDSVVGMQIETPTSCATPPLRLAVSPGHVIGVDIDVTRIQNH